jgi:D-alanyl-lipoteichoic acid acyltransferase DltB (MBOAT superfamily)
MLFNSAAFVVFLLVTLAVYWGSSSLAVRRIVLLIASLVFYAFWDFRFLALIAYVTGVAYAGARAMQAWPGYRKRILVASIVLELAELVFFKYTNFLLETLGHVAKTFGLSLPVSHVDILLPVGISFYTFHGVSYVVDVYRGKLSKTYDLISVALYIVFFPQLVAGPIVRADVFLPQLERTAKLDTRDLIIGVKFATIGLVYKCVFADRLGPFVDDVFGSPAAYDRPSLLSAALGFYSQIYFDFAGYSLTAIGVSRLFGFRLPKNFDFPYRSTSVTEFWRRWHISLSSWLRDYLYIPLGGNRRGAVLQYRNLMLTMLLGGLWHGASVNFLVWGGLHGVALAVHKLFRTLRPLERATGFVHVLRSSAAWFLTQAFVLVAWVPFRARTLSNTVTVLRAFLPGSDAGFRAAAIPLTLLFLPLLADHVLVGNPKLPAIPWPRRPLLVLGMVGVCFALALPFLELKVRNFIYFQF